MLAEWCYGKRVLWSFGWTWLNQRENITIQASWVPILEGNPLYPAVSGITSYLASAYHWGIIMITQSMVFVLYMHVPLLVVKIVLFPPLWQSRDNCHYRAWSDHHVLIHVRRKFLNIWSKSVSWLVCWFIFIYAFICWVNQAIIWFKWFCLNR